jgi:tyrosyl-tRNA synthetase
MLTFLPLEEIDAMDKWEGAQLNKAKEILAFELTKLVHGEEEAAKAEASAKALFGNGADANVPTVELTDADFVDGCIDIVTLITKMGLCTSKSESRRSVEQGGVTVNGEKVSDIKAVYTKDQIAEGPVVKRGKKTFKKVIVK